MCPNSARNRRRSRRRDRHTIQAIASCGTTPTSVVASRSEGFPNGICYPCAQWTGVWSHGKIVGASSSSSSSSSSSASAAASSGNSGWHSGQETIFGVFHMVLGSWWEISENGDRGSTQNFDTNLMSIVVWPGEPFSKNVFFVLFPRLPCSFFQEQVPKMCFPRCANQKGAWRHIQIHIQCHMHIHIHILCIYMYKYIYLTWVPARPPARPWPM